MNEKTSFQPSNKKSLIFHIFFNLMLNTIPLFRTFNSKYSKCDKLLPSQWVKQNIWKRSPEFLVSIKGSRGLWKLKIQFSINYLFQRSHQNFYPKSILVREISHILWAVYTFFIFCLLYGFSVFFLLINMLNNEHE